MRDQDVADAPVRPPDRGRSRRTSALWLATACLVSATLAATVVVALGIERRVLDGRAWVEAVAPLADDPRLLDRIADDVTEEALARLDLVGRAEGLPLDSPLLEGLASAVAEAATEAARPIVRAMVRERLDSAAFRALWLEASRAGHEVLLAAVRDPLPAGGATDVVLDVAPLVRDVLDDDVDPFLARALPDDLRLPVTILAAQDLVALRSALRLLRALGVLASLALLVTVVAAAVMAGQRAVVAVLTFAAATLGALTGARWLTGSDRRLREAFTASLAGDGTPTELSDLLTRITAGLTVALVITVLVVLTAAVMAASAARARRRAATGPVPTASEDPAARG